MKMVTHGILMMNLKQEKEEISLVPTAHFLKNKKIMKVCIFKNIHFICLKRFLKMAGTRVKESRVI